MTGLEAHPDTGRSVQEPTYSARTTLVQLPVVVTDRDGHVVDGLEKSGFQVYDEGKAVEVETFIHVRILPPDRSGIATALRAPNTGPTADRNRVLWVVFDDLHMSAIRVPAAQRIARSLIERWLGPGDLIGVRQVGSSSNVTTLTDRVGAVMKAIADFQARPQTQLHEDEQIARAAQVTDTLAAIATAMEKLADRRITILLLSEGIEYDVFNVQAPGSSSIVQGTEHAISALRRANVVLCAIDPRGLTSTEGIAVETGAQGGSVEASLADAANRLRVATLSLRQISEQTGGFASVDRNNFDEAIDRIGREMSDYYLLGFVPRDARCEHGVRRLRVRVRMKDVRVRARSLYACGE